MALRGLDRLVPTQGAFPSKKDSNRRETASPSGEKTGKNLENPLTGAAEEDIIISR